MLRHVLIPLDGSPLAEQALPWTRQIMTPDGHITLVTALHMPDALSPAFSGVMPRGRTETEITGVGDYDKWEQRVTQDVYRYLDGVAAGLKRSIASSLTVDFVVASGDPASLIIEAAQEKHVDAIVMSTHGRSGFQRWLFGSVAVRVMEARVCPVFMIPGMQTEPTKEAMAPRSAAQPT
ncbi:MAG: universal stress protein [Anaerolineae bacterium]|nr:universal stress protein [Anaerolineae bacterium]